MKLVPAADLGLAGQIHLRAHHAVVAQLYPRVDHGIRPDLHAHAQPRLGINNSCRMNHYVTTDDHT